MKVVRTTCAYCGVGCGIIATPTGERTATIAGDPDHPANFGKLCSKGTHLGETIGLEGRLLHPMIGSARASWDETLDLVASRFAATIAEHGPGSVAFYVSGQLLTEDYYVANKLMKGFIGTANIDTNSRLCMASAVTGHVRAFGEDVVPCTYDDLDAADLIVLVGSNTAWCHPVVWQRIEAARKTRGTKLVVIDPRRTETADGADLHLAIRPGTDTALFNGLLAHMKDSGGLDADYLAAHVSVPDGFWDSLSGDTAICDLPPADLAAFYALFAAHPRTVTLFSQGVNQSVRGTDKVNAITNLHLATGRIGKPGAAPFSITGQPNAMGGREVGGMASTLAAHLSFSDHDRSVAQRFWQSPAIAQQPGLKAVDMFEAIADGRIKAVWIMATNPMVSLPDAGAARDALANCPFVVVSDCIADTDTSAFAHVRLPALGWGEKDGTVTNSERRISRQRAFLASPGEAKSDWWALAEVAKRMGWASAFDFTGPAAIFAEFAAMTRFENDGSRLLRIDTPADYDAMAPTLWGGAQPFADGRYPTLDGKARMLAVEPEPVADDPAFPFHLNTGRYRDQWHTMTRTGLSPRLSQHRRAPLVEIHPDDARAFGLADGGLARITTASGDSIYRVALHDGQRRAELFVPIHWADRTATLGRTGRLPGKARDPLSGQPGFKNTPARIEAVAPAWSGFLVSRDEPGTPLCDHWTRIRVPGGWLIELAGAGDPDALLPLLPTGETAEVRDRGRGSLRAVAIDDGRLTAALFIVRDGSLPPRDWLLGQLVSAVASPVELLAGRSATPQPDRGPIVCVCFDIGLNTIVTAIASQRLVSVEAVGEALNAGTNCGSCRPAIANLLAPVKEAAHA